MTRHLLLCALLAAPLVPFAAAEEPEKKPVEQFVAQRMGEVNALVERIGAAQDSEERERLMGEYRQKMQENMDMVRRMLAAPSAAPAAQLHRPPYGPRMRGYPGGMPGGYGRGAGPRPGLYPAAPAAGPASPSARPGPRMNDMARHQAAVEERLANIEALLRKYLEANAAQSR